jgi:FAD:protein FMN transferase
MAELRRMRPALGTFVEIRVIGSSAPALRMALEQAFSAIATVERLMSWHRPDSALHELHQHAQHASVTVHPWLADVLRESLALSAASDGRFDITVAPHLVAHGLLPPMAATLNQPPGTWRDITVTADDQVSFATPVLIDLGGIAKGFAVDRAVEALQQAGVDGGVVNAGGDLRCFGPLELPVAIRDASDHRAIAQHLLVRNRAIASSSSVFSGPADERRRDPHSGAAMNRAWTVAAPTCACADGLTKALTGVADIDGPLLARFDAQAWRLDNNDSDNSALPAAVSA